MIVYIFLMLTHKITHFPQQLQAHAYAISFLLLLIGPLPEASYKIGSVRPSIPLSFCLSWHFLGMVSLVASKF